MKLADAHVHFFAQGYRSRYGVLFPAGRELSVYQSFRRVHQIDAVLAIGYEGPSYRGNNNDLARVAHLNHWIHPLAYCSVEKPPAPHKLATRLNQRFSGISLYVPTQIAAQQMNRWSEKLVAFLNHWRALVSINIPLVHLTTLRPFLERLPETRILISHLGLPSIPRRSASSLRPLTILSNCPHVGIKASAFYACGNAYPHPASQPIFTELLQAFGPRRIYWGSDFSPALGFVSFAQTIDILESFPLGDDDRRNILGDNLRTILKRPRRLL